MRGGGGWGGGGEGWGGEKGDFWSGLKVTKPDLDKSMGEAL